MGAVRRHLRVYVAVWLTFQAAALSSVVPRDCCAAHRPAPARSSLACHEAQPAPPDVHAHHAPAPDTDTCSMRGACRGPMAGFLAQISLHGILGDRPHLALDVVTSHLQPLVREHPTSRLVAPDPPPPRV